MYHITPLHIFIYMQTYSHVSSQTRYNSARFCRHVAAFVYDTAMDLLVWLEHGRRNRGAR
jgi:hypothetical protein